MTLSPQKNTSVTPLLMISTIWSGPYGPGPFIIWKNFPNQICSRTIFEMHTQCSRTIFEMLTAYRSMFAMLLEQYAFQIWSWSIFDLENSLRLWMVEDHKVLMILDHMVLDHKSRPKSHKSGETALHSTNGIVVDSPVKKQTRTWDILRSPSNWFSIKTTFIRDGATKLLKQYQ